MLGNLSRTTLYGCAAVGGATALGVLAARVNKKLGFAVFCSVLSGAAYIYYKYIYQPEQTKTQINQVSQYLGCEDDAFLRSPREVFTPSKGTLVFKNPIHNRSHNQNYYDGATTDDDLTDDEEMKDIDLSYDDNPIPREEPTSKPVVKLKPGLGNYILSLVGLGQREKEKAI